MFPENTLRAVWRAGDPAGLNPKGAERVGLHDLRHSCAGLLLAAGVSMPKVAAVLGHSNPRITADVYAGLVETGRAALGADLAAAFEKVMSPSSPNPTPDARDARLGIRGNARAGPRNVGVFADTAVFVALLR